MKRTTWLIATLATTLSVAACDKGEQPTPTPEAKTESAAADKPAADPHDAFTDLKVADVAGLIKEKKCVAVDANGSATREKFGVVPGAVLLSSTDYKLDELPKEKDAKLVFYCSSQKCSAAPRAAVLAKKAGYKDVNVMRAGIRGWVDAGEKVDKPTT